MLKDYVFWDAPTHLGIEIKGIIRFACPSQVPTGHVFKYIPSFLFISSRHSVDHWTAPGPGTLQAYEYRDSPKYNICCPCTEFNKGCRPISQRANKPTTAAWKVLGLRCAQNTEWKLRRLIYTSPGSEWRDRWRGNSVWNRRNSMCRRIEAWKSGGCQQYG